MSVNIRRCKTCHKTFPLERFPTAGVKKSKKYYRYVCKKCYQRRKNKRRSAQRKWFDQYKETLKCSKCGYSKETHKSFSVRALAFHHKNPKEKVDEVSNLIRRGFSKALVQKEINKCDVLCSRCHSEHHHS